MAAFKRDVQALGDGLLGAGTELCLESWGRLRASDLVLQGRGEQREGHVGRGAWRGHHPPRRARARSCRGCHTGVAEEAEWWPWLGVVVATAGLAGFTPVHNGLCTHSEHGVGLAPCPVSLESISDVDPRATVSSFSP